MNELFNDRDKRLIQRIPIPSQRRRDTWFWLLDTKGKFTVNKSMYQHLQGMYDTSYASFWKKLWSLKFLGKVTNLIWRICKGCLPTLTALALKHIIVDTRCPWCNCESENDFHVFFECGFAKTVWTMTRLQNCIVRLQDETCMDFFARVFKSANRDQCAMISMTCWSLWNRRNKWVWDRINGSAFSVKVAALNLLTD